MRAFVRALRDLLRGLFGFPERGIRPGGDAAAAIEERYRRPQRCC